jgi:hypothetical protein
MTSTPSFFKAVHSYITTLHNTVVAGALFCGATNCCITHVGLARAIYIRCVYGIFGRKITKYTVIYGVYIQFWPTLHTRHKRVMGGPSLRLSVGVG